MPTIGQEQSPPKLAVPQPSTLAKANARHKVELRNGLQTIVVAEGDTYESLSKELKKKDWELYTYNDFEKGRQPRPNEILYLQHKHKKADKKHLKHVAEDGDTMHYISQRYGLKLKPLLRRNRMNRGEEPSAGQVVYLRNKRPR
jgi:LysM repeat protein